jgi:hypothetical protein
VFVLLFAAEASGAGREEATVKNLEARALLFRELASR